MASKDKIAYYKNLVLLFLSLVVALFLGEIMLRLILPPPIIWKYPQEKYQFDPEIGHWLVSRQQAFSHDKVVVTNSQGLRDIDYPRNALAGVQRILALGDSQTFGNGLDQDNTWPKQMERLLNNNHGTKYEVINGGLPASDTWQHEIILERLLEIYQPDVVVLAFYVNDVVTRPDVIRYPKSSNRDSLVSRCIYFVKQSSLLLVLKSVYDSISQIWAPSEGLLRQNALLRGEGGPVIDKRWGQVERSLARMRKITAANNIGFWVVSLPRRDQVSGQYPAVKYNERLRSIFDKYEIPYINMLEPLENAYREHGRELFIPWDGHYSMVANGIIASEISMAIHGLPNDSQ